MSPKNDSLFHFSVAFFLLPSQSPIIFDIKS